MGHSYVQEVLFITGPVNWRRCGYAIGCAALALTGFAAFMQRPNASAADILSKRVAAQLAQAEGKDDVVAMLEALSAADDGLRDAPEASELHFSRARALDVLGIGRPAARAYAMYLRSGDDPDKIAEAQNRLFALRNPRASPDRWRTALPRLRDAAIQGRRDEVERIVTEFSAKARRWGEVKCLSEWAYAIQIGRVDAAARALTVAREIGRVLVATSGESLLHDAVSNIDEATDAADVQRIAVLARAHALLDKAAGQSEPKRKKLMTQAADGFVAGRSPMALIASAAQLEIFEVPPRYRALRAWMDCRKGDRFANKGDIAGAQALYASAIHEYEELQDHENACNARTADAQLLRDRADAWRARRRVLAAAAATADTSQLRRTLIHAARAAMREQMWRPAESLLDLVEDTSGGHEAARAEIYLLRAVAQWFARRDLTASKQNLENARILANVSVYRDEHLTLLVEVAESAIVREADPKRAAALLGSALMRLTASNKAASDLGLITVADELSDVYRGSTNVHSELVDIFDGWGRTAEAFRVSEAGRGKMLHARTAARLLTAAELQQTMPDGTLLVSFSTLKDRLIVFAITKDEYHVIRRNVARAQVDRLVEQYTTDVAAGKDTPASASTLYKTLFGSLDLSQTKALVVVADESLSRIPFSVLMNARMNVVLAPSGSMYAHLAKMPDAPRKTALVVGDPAFSVAAFPSLSRLPAAAAEAREIAALYEAKLLFDTHARQDPFLHGMAKSDVIHVAAHVQDGVLILAGAELAPEDIAVMQAKAGSIAILAGCRTGGMGGDHYIGSLALAFLAAGSRSAIATLWNVEDSAARRFSRRLHHHLTRGLPAAQAVRRVQLEMIAAGVPARTWGAFQVYGGG